MLQCLGPLPLVQREMHRVSEEGLSGEHVDDVLDDIENVVALPKISEQKVTADGTYATQTALTISK